MAELGPLPDTINPNYFPAKLWILVNDPANEAVRWDSTGRLVIIDQQLLESRVLAPGGAAGALAFKTTNFSSFVRQLNLYGFKKADATNQDGLESGPCHYFWNGNFQRNRPDLVASLRRFTVGNKAKLQAGLDLKTRLPSGSEAREGGQLVTRESISLLRSAQQLLNSSHLSSPASRPRSGTPMLPRSMKRVHAGHLSSPGDSAGPFKTPYPVWHSCHPNLTTSQILDFNRPKNYYQAGKKSISKSAQEKENDGVQVCDVNLDKVFQIADEVMQSFSGPRLVPGKTSVVVAAPSSSNCGAAQHKNTKTAVFAVNATSSSVVVKQEEASAPSGLQQTPEKQSFLQLPLMPHRKKKP